ncbi:hypothetical protein ACGFIJ_29980 [Microbispora bryophytorum]|uniref:hypothetical protein n=1 Tax=Microbispora bryophytorum TaxID=1460882 RepID=UPI00371C57BD
MALQALHADLSARAPAELVDMWRLLSEIRSPLGGALPSAPVLADLVMQILQAEIAVGAVAAVESAISGVS